MNSDKILLRELLKTIHSYRKKIILITLLSVAFFFQLTFWMQKQFVSTFEINVYSKYFQNPLVSGVIPDVYNIPEMRFAIDSMAKEAIDDEFIDEIGRAYKIYSGTSDEREKAKERQFLRDRIAYFSTGGQSYQISFSHEDPYKAKEIADKLLVRIKEHIVNKRIKTIILVKEVMMRKLNSFNASQKLTQQDSEKALASKSPDVLKEELVKVTTSIDALSKQYSDTHPIIKNLKQRKKIILNWLEEFDLSTLGDSSVDLPIAVTHDKVISEQLSSKFYAKYHDFNIALEIEKRSIQSYIGIIKQPQLPAAPLWPKKRLFASLGFILGLIISFLYVFINEILIPNKSEKVEIEANSLSTLVLGTLPRLSHDEIENLFFARREDVTENRGHL